MQRQLQFGHMAESNKPTEIEEITEEISEAIIALVKQDSENKMIESSGRNENKDIQV